MIQDTAHMIQCFENNYKRIFAKQKKKATGKAFNLSVAICGRFNYIKCSKWEDTLK